jgi:hypothetical protein
MKQPITGFHKDEQGDWVAELKSGPAQPTLATPPVVASKEGRKSRLGSLLNCKKCGK